MRTEKKMLVLAAVAAVALGTVPGGLSGALAAHSKQQVIHVGVPHPAHWRTKYGRHGAQNDYDKLREGNIPTPTHRGLDPRTRGVAQLKAMASTATVGGSWAALGPKPVDFPTGQGFNFPEASGRVLSLAYASSTHTIYLGSADGGVWKSTDGGATWTALTDDMPSLAIGALAVDPNNNNVIYAGTGEQAGCVDCLYGIGIYKSTNSGATWTHYGDADFSGQAISAIRVDPTDSNRVYASVVAHATSGQSSPFTAGVAVSTDGGQTWTEPDTTSISFSNVADLAIDNAGNLYAAVPGTGVFYSSDHAATWNAVSTGLPDSSGGADQIRIALDPSTAGSAQGSQRLYAVIGDNGQISNNFGGLLGIYRTTNGGGSWTQIGDSTSTGDQGHQAWYDIYIAVDPGDTTGNTVYVGLTDIYKTTNARATTPSWTNITRVYSCDSTKTTCPAIHPDQHAVLFVPTNTGETAYFGDDGGVYQSTDGGGTFTSDNTTLTISQFYDGSLSPQNPTWVTGGLQDNGAIETHGTLAWTEVFGGDGFFTATDPTTAQIQYEEYANGDISRTMDDWSSATDISDSAWFPQNGSPDPTNFSTPFVLDPNSRTTLYMGRNHLWRTTNSTATTPTWTDISSSLTTNNITAIGAAKSTPGTIYIGDSSAHMWLTTNGTAASPTWASLDGSNFLCDSNNPSPYTCATGGVTGIAVDPTNSHTVYVSDAGFQGAQQFHIFKSTDSGTTWTDISATLPDLPFQSITVNPTAPGAIYAGADSGVYVSTDGGATWNVLGTGLPNASVYSLVPSSDGSYLIAFTHGRGAWKISTNLGPARSSRLTPTPVAVGTITPTPVANRRNRLTPTPVLAGATATPTGVGGRQGR